MIPCGILIDELFDILNADADQPMQNRIWRRLNYEYLEICSKIRWNALTCEPLSLNFASAGTTGMWVPSDLLGVDTVWDDTDDVEFLSTERAAAAPNGWGYRYYTYYPSRSDYYSGTDLVLTKDAVSFTSAKLTALTATKDPDEMYVRFDDEPGLYLISSSTTPFTFTPTYHGENKTQKTFAIRPWEVSQKMIIVDGAETKLTDRTVSVYYWRKPTPLYRKQDMILLPTTDLLKLKVLRGIPQAKADFPVNDRMIAKALGEAITANKRSPGIVSPRDKHGLRIDSDAVPFKTR